MRNPAFVTSSLVILALIVSGCGAGGENAESAPASEPLQGIASSEAWNAEIDRVLAETQSDSVREVLADYTITEAEMSRVRDDLAACLQPLGVTEIDFQENGYETNVPEMDPDSFNKEMDRCDSEVGYSALSILYYGILGNPSREDRTQLIVDCLVAKGLVPSGYSVENYRRDLDSGTFPFEMDGRNPELFVECSSLG